MSLTKQDLKQIEKLLARRFSNFEVKMDKKFAAQTKELKAYTDKQTEDLARIIATSIVTPMNYNFRVIGDKLNIVDQLIFEKPKFKYKSK